MRRVAVLALLVATSTGAALASSSALSASTRSVKVGDNYFERSKGVPVVTVSRNTRVTWRWVGDSDHDVKVSSGPIKFKSKVMSHGATYSRVMSRSGTYRLFCEVHGAKDQSMVLRVK